MTTQTPQQMFTEMQNFFNNITQEELDDIVDNRMTDEDRNQLAELVADLQEAQNNRDQAPPPYEGDGWNLPSYESIQDSPPDYY